MAGAVVKPMPMEAGILTITLQPDWKAALCASARKALKADSSQGDRLNFESAAAFFGKLTERRWAMIHALQGAGEVPVRELARRVGRDVKRVHEDAGVLVCLGLIGRTARGGLLCSYDEIHGDMHLRHAAQHSLILGTRPTLAKYDRAGSSVQAMRRQYGSRFELPHFLNLEIACGPFRTWFRSAPAPQRTRQPPAS